MWKEAVLASKILEGPRKPTKNFIPDCQSRDRDSNPGPPEFKAGVLTSASSCGSDSLTELFLLG
jgi:hypothetical protein